MLKDHGHGMPPGARRQSGVPMPENVHCKDCGFLAIRRKETREIVEVEGQIRHAAEFPGEPMYSKFLVWKDPTYESRPLCFAREHHLDVAPLEREAEHERESRFMVMIGATRDCDSFTPWIQGFTPREHREMLDRKLILDWQEDQAKKDREWRERQADDDRKWREKESALARNANRIHFWEIVIIAAIAIGAIIAQVYTTTLQIDAQREHAPP